MKITHIIIDFQIPAEGVEGHVAELDVKEVGNKQKLWKDEVQVVWNVRDEVTHERELIKERNERGAQEDQEV